MAVKMGCGAIGGKTAVESVRDVAKQTLTDNYKKHDACPQTKYNF